MPVLPRSTVYVCPACGWSAVVRPHSDALMPGEMFERCPRCDHAPLQQRDPGALAQGLARMLRWAGRGRR